jgi:hypothetical protein
MTGIAQEPLTVTASYTNCTFLGICVAVNMNNCDYLLNADGSVDIASVAGKTCNVITYEGPGCKITVARQALPTRILPEGRSH